jgi:hypothetical protein
MQVQVIWSAPIAAIDKKGWQAGRQAGGCVLGPLTDGCGCGCGLCSSGVPAVRGVPARQGGGARQGTGSIIGSPSIVMSCHLGPTVRLAQSFVRPSLVSRLTAGRQAVVIPLCAGAPNGKVVEPLCVFVCGPYVGAGGRAAAPRHRSLPVAPGRRGLPRRLQHMGTQATPLGDGEGRQLHGRIYAGHPGHGDDDNKALIGGSSQAMGYVWE